MKANFLFLILLVLATGCIGNFVDQGQSTEGLVFKLTADPQRAFINDNVRLIMDVENKDIKEYKDVAISIFDLGILQGRCDTFTFEKLLSATQHNTEEAGQFKTFYCYVVTPEGINEAEATTTVYAKATYTTSFKLVQLIEMVSEEYYNAHLGQIQKKPKSYVYRDKNLEVAIDFSTELPVVLRQGTKTFMRVQVINIGNGFVGPIKDMKIKPAGNQQYDIFQKCSFGRIEQTGNSFPKQSCEIELPYGIEYLTNYDAILEFTYDYEVRADTEVTIMRGY